MTLNLIFFFILLIFSAFFSATEVAFVSLSNAKVSVMVKKRLPKSLLVQKLKKDPRRLLVTVLIGNNLVNIAAASLATLIASELFSSAVFGIATGITTILILIFGEIVPKSFASNHPKQVALLSAGIIYILERVGLPIIFLFEQLTNLLTGKQRAESISEDELKAMALAGAKQGTIEKEEGAMIEKLFQFNDITAEDVMTPRVDVVCVEDNMSIEQAAKVIEETPHTRFPVAHDTPDEIIGFVHSRNVLLAYTHDRENASIKDIMHPIIKVPKQLPIDDLLKEFQKKQVHMAVVMDEYGGTEGIATLEDVLEELVGEIADEHDVEEHDLIKRINKHTILVSGDTVVREINDFFNIELPGDPFDTIAEIILDQLQKIPRVGMEADFGGIKCIIFELDDKAITQVKIVKPIV